MRTKNTIWFYLLIIVGLVLVLNNGCKKDDKKEDPKPEENTVKDIDGNSYHYVTIGTQVWMVENLKTTKYSDGSSIPNITSNTAWGAATTGAYCDFDNSPSISDTYGRFYNWYAASDPRKIAPTGWHVPTEAEWKTLVDYLIANGYNYNGSTTDNKCAKSIGSTTGWESSTTAGAVGNTDFPELRNKTGFNGLAAGFRDEDDGACDYMHYYAHWWTSSEADATKGYGTDIYCSYSDITYDAWIPKSRGYSIRCIKD